MSRSGPLPLIPDREHITEIAIIAGPFEYALRLTPKYHLAEGGQKLLGEHIPSAADIERMLDLPMVLPIVHDVYGRRMTTEIEFVPIRVLPESVVVEAAGKGAARIRFETMYALEKRQGQRSVWDTPEIMREEGGESRAKFFGWRAEIKLGPLAKGISRKKLEQLHFSPPEKCGDIEASFEGVGKERRGPFSYILKLSAAGNTKKIFKDEGPAERGALNHLLGTIAANSCESRERRYSPTL